MTVSAEKPQPHTPTQNVTGGQWDFACDSYGKVKHSRKACVYSVVKGQGGGDMIVTVAGRIEKWDDAKLMAAAPDLLAALEALYEHCAMVHKTWGDGSNQREADAAIASGRAAIAKAKGGVS